jgi:antitoxin component YwqK of YwqJK toxin-antitoxin module
MSSGKVQSKIHHIAGIKHGNYKLYNCDGNIIVDKNYKYNILHGNYKGYRQGYRQGELILNVNYEDGLLHGECYKYDNGVRIITNFVYGKKHGNYKKYCGNILVVDANFVNDKKNGNIKTWNFYGDLISDDTYRNGVKHGICKNYFGRIQMYHNGVVIDNKKIKALKAIANYRQRVKEYANCLGLTPRQFYNLSLMVKTRPFIEWYYHPENYGGRRHKKIMAQFFAANF